MKCPNNYLSPNLGRFGLINVIQLGTAEQPTQRAFPDLALHQLQLDTPRYPLRTTVHSVVADVQPDLTTRVSSPNSTPVVPFQPLRLSS